MIERLTLKHFCCKTFAEFRGKRHLGKVNAWKQQLSWDREEPLSSNSVHPFLKAACNTHVPLCQNWDQFCFLPRPELPEIIKARAMWLVLEQIMALTGWACLCSFQSCIIFQTLVFSLMNGPGYKSCLLVKKSSSREWGGMYVKSGLNRSRELHPCTVAVHFPRVPCC